jgi:hypothetical protein
MFELDTSYTRKEIHAKVGGSVQSYLPHVNGVVRAACLRLDSNPDAPAVILVGTGSGIERAAEMFIAQKAAVPTFVKYGTGKWRYVGDYAIKRSSQDPTEISEHARRSDRRDITMILYMDKVLAPAGNT